MKKLSFIILSGLLIFANTSCKKFLNINQNPNQATSSTPDVVLPQALVYTADNVSNFNNYGSQLVGYMANAGGYGGFGSSWTYDFSTNDYSGLWSSSYDVLNDIQYVINSTNGIDAYSYFNAAARIMKAYNFELLVDTYNNVPYTGALSGTNNLTPKYDDAKAIYVSLANQLDSAIATINAAVAPTALTAATDPLFAGNMTQWKQFANTIKLRLIVRASGQATFANTSFSTDGFLTTDAVVNPGYQRATGQQNPAWNTWVGNYAGSAGNRAWMSSSFVFGFYNGPKLMDTLRGMAIYTAFPKTPINQLGDGLTGVPSAPALANDWYTGPGSSISTLGNAIGIMKGPNMGQPLMLAAESYFLQAEADVRGILSGSAQTNFYKGIQASFNYLYLLPNLTLASGYNPVADATSYENTNNTSYLVNFSLATTTDQQIEAIITQKYIALNMIHGHEAWNEYRRTLYPKIVNGSQDGNLTFASTLSQSTRADKLPARIQYPASEYSYNSANVPTGISPFTSLIFWAHQ